MFYRTLVLVARNEPSTAAVVPCRSAGKKYCHITSRFHYAIYRSRHRFAFLCFSLDLSLRATKITLTNERPIEFFLTRQTAEHCAAFWHFSQNVYTDTNSFKSFYPPGARFLSIIRHNSLLQHMR
jgi:hypothetical protein